jgi:hypothetical protein
MAKTFLQLTNDALREAGIYLDPLTSSNFAAPGEHMYERFKEWVNQSARDTVLERKEWEFQSRNAVVVISPRVYVEAGSRATAPPAGSTFVTTETETTFEVVSTTTLSGSWAGSTATAFIDFIEIDGVFKFNESVDEVTPTPANEDVFIIRDWGTYNLQTLFPDLDEANPSSFFLQGTGGSTVQDNEDAADIVPLVYIPRGNWSDWYETAYGAFGTPRYITTALNGNYELWPRPDKQYVLKFNYSASPINMSAYTDTTNLPSFYEDAIVWRAVLYYAQFEGLPAVEAKANKRYKFYKRILDANHKPKYAFGRSKFD